MPLFELPPIRWPDWYTPAKGRVRSNQRVARGRHPNGLDLGPEDSTCGACAHLVKKGRWRKCPSTMGDTRSTASDVVRAWRGCARFAWVHRHVALQGAMAGGQEQSLTACGLLIPQGEQASATGEGITCPACRRDG